MYKELSMLTLEHLKSPVRISFIFLLAIITPVWDANRAHPGAAHYLIHSYDDPVHAIH